MSDETLKALQEQNEALQKQLEAAAKGNMTEEERKRLQYLEGEHKTLIEARDKAKEDKRIAEEKRLAEQGEFKTIAEQRANEIEQLSKGSEEMKAKLAEYQKRDEDELKTLTDKVPESFREDLADTSLSLDVRLKLARKLATSKPHPAGYRPPGEPEPDTLKARYDDAVKRGDVMAQISLKRQLAEGT